MDKDKDKEIEKLAERIVSKIIERLTADLEINEHENPVVASGWIARDKDGDYHRPYEMGIVRFSQITEKHLTKTKEEVIAVAKYTYYAKFAPYTPVQVQIRKDGTVEVVKNQNNV